MGFKFQGFDFLHLDSSFSEDELFVRKTARDFVEDNLIPIIEECFRTERFPRELVPIMGELGFYGANLEGYGCAGMSNVEYGLIAQELERLSEQDLDRLMAFLRSLADAHAEAAIPAAAAESSLAKDWLTPEEDAAWASL